MCTATLAAFNLTLLVRAREVAKKDQLGARHRLGKCLLRRGLRAAAGMKSWTSKHLLWVKTLRFEHPAQEAIVRWLASHRGAPPLTGARSPVLRSRVLRRQALGEEDDAQGRWVQETA